MARTFANNALRRVYDTCRKLAADRSSEFYLADGRRHTGANVRNAYWKGLDGLASTYGKSSMLHAAWAAGRDDRGDQDGSRARHSEVGHPEGVEPEQPRRHGAP